MVTLTLREATAERLEKLARAKGLTVEETIEALVEQAEPLSADSGQLARQIRAANYGLEPDDPLLDLIGASGDSELDAVTLIDQTMDEFYRSHSDRPR